MPWYGYSLIALLMFSFFTICQRWSANLKIGNLAFNFWIYFGALVSLIALNFNTLGRFIDKLEIFWFWGLIASLFSVVSGITEFQANRTAPNSGYSTAIRNTNMLPLLLLSPLFFPQTVEIKGSYILGVGLILVGITVLAFQEVKKNSIEADKPRNWKWLLYAFTTTIFLAGMFLACRYMTDPVEKGGLGLDSKELNLLIFSFGTIAFLLLNMGKLSLPKRGNFKPVYIVPIVLAIIASVIGNLASFHGNKIASNPGLSVAVMNIDAIVIMILAFLFFGKKNGGEMNIKKWLGAGISVVGTLILIFATN